jgi:hypothetical protein
MEILIDGKNYNSKERLGSIWAGGFKRRIADKVQRLFFVAAKRILDPILDHPGGSTRRGENYGTVQLQLGFYSVSQGEQRESYITRAMLLLKRLRK